MSDLILEKGRGGLEGGGAESAVTDHAGDDDRAIDPTDGPPISGMTLADLLAPGFYD